MIPKRLLLIIGTFLLAVLLYVDRICISTAKDGITQDLGLTDKQLGWVLSAFALGYALFQTPNRQEGSWARGGGIPAAEAASGAQRSERPSNEGRLGSRPSGRLSVSAMLSSGNMWLAMTQYFCSNFTFFFMLSWLFPYLLDWTGTHETFFYVAAALNVIATFLWLAVKPEQPLEEIG